jgi:hypothetical protein
MLEKQLTALDKLNNLAYQSKIEQFPNIPLKAIPRTKYSDGSANDLTKCVIDFLRLKGFWASRIQSQGQVRGNIRTYGTTQRGVSDVHSCVNGIFLSIEIKYGKDKLSEAQNQVKMEVERSGGIFLEIKTFEQFYKFYCEFQNIPY